MERDARVRHGMGEGFSFKEPEVKSSVGVAVLIVGYDPSRNGENESDPLLWTVTELIGKPETSKFAGQISTPSETRKKGENEENNLFGALTEFCDDTVFSSYLKHHVIKVDGHWYRGKGAIVNDRLVDVAVLIYDGALDFPFKPVCPEEVKPNGWVKKSELMTDPRLRDVFKQILELDNRENLIRKTLGSYRNNPERRKSIFPEHMDSIEKFSIIREHGVDTRVMPYGYIEARGKMPEAHKFLSEVIANLANLQNQEKRNYSKEDEIVAKFMSAHKTFYIGSCELVLNEVNAIRIKKTSGIPKSWNNNIKLQNIKKGLFSFLLPGGSIFFPVETNKNKNEAKIQQIPDAKIKAGGYAFYYGDYNISMGFARGDRLGYPKELGKKWYLVFGGEEGICYAPVDGIKDFNLRINDTSF